MQGIFGLKRTGSVHAFQEFDSNQIKKECFKESLHLGTLVTTTATKERRLCT